MWEQAENVETRQYCGGDADRNRSKRSARNAEWTRQIRLAEAQYRQRYKLEREAKPIEKNVECHQPGKAEAQTHRPSNRQRDNGNPWSPRLRVQLAKNARQHPILRHRKRQARIAHHHSVKHAESADDATENYAHPH